MMPKSIDIYSRYEPDEALAPIPVEYRYLAIADGVLLKHPITLGGDEFVEELAVAPFEQSWMMVTAATLNPPGAEAVACELRCRVMSHAKAWFVAGVLGPARHAAPIAWMQNKRAVELVTTMVWLG